MRYSFFLFLVISIFSGILFNTGLNSCVLQEKKISKPADRISIRILHSVEPLTEKQAHPNKGFGFNIFLNSKLLIHQPFIPGIQGNKPFRTASDARKTGRLMIRKIERNIIPPTITEAELDSLRIVW
jgi:hypothetical protein